MKISGTIQKTLISMRVLKNSYRKKYPSGEEVIGKKGDILCTEILTNFSWIEGGCISSKYPARYKLSFVANDSLVYAYTNVYTVTVKTKIVIVLPNKKRLIPKLGDLILLFTSGATCVVRNNFVSSLWTNTKSNKKTVLEF